MFRAACFSLFVLCAAPVAAQEAISAPGESASDRVEIAGTLDRGADRVGLAGLSVTLNGVTASLDAKGHFHASIPRSEFYQLRVTGARVFTAFQTFGADEITDTACACLTIPAVELIERRKGRVEMFFGGDTMAGRRYFAPPDGERLLLRAGSVDADLDALLAPMKPYIESADLASVNMETVLADDEPGPKLPNKRIAFVSTPALAGALARAGVDYVTLGNNHVYDFQQPGIAGTLEALDQTGMAHSGAGHDEASANAPARIDVGKNRFTLIGYVGWEGSNGAIQVAAGTDKGGAALATRGQVRRSVQAAVRDGRIPVLQYHGGSEYTDRPGPTTLSRLRTAADHGAPLVIGHHPHVTQGVEVYRGALIAPSIGNFMFDQQFLNTQTGYVVKAILDKGRFLRAEFVPIAIVDYRPVPAVGRARGAALRRLFGLSAENGTHLGMSGGHAVVRRDAMEPRAEAACNGGSAGEFRLSSFAPLCGVAGQRLGREIIGRGDFALARSNGAFERAFGAENASVDFGAAGEEGQRLLLRPIAADKPVALYTQGYLRDAPPGDYLLTARVRLPAAARVELMIKDRPLPGVKPAPRWRGESVGAVTLSAGEGWQDIRFSFSQPAEADGTARLFRPILRFVWANGAGTMLPIAVDDLSVLALAPDDSVPDLAARWRASGVDGVELSVR